MSDDDLIARLRSQIGDDVQHVYDHEALFRLSADRIEALVKQCKGLAQAAMNNGQALILAEDRAERLEAALLSLPTVYAHQINTGVREVYDPLQRFYTMESVLTALKGDSHD